MSRLFLTSVDLNRNELLNPRIHNLTAAPGTTVEGLLYADTTEHALYYHNGTTWKDLTGRIAPQLTGDVTTDGTTNVTIIGDGKVLAKHLAGSIPLSKLEVDPLARGNHTGTQTASTISDLATTVKAYRLDEFAKPTASLDANSQKIVNVATPTAAGDAANKGYVDAVSQGLDLKDSCLVATTAAITLSGTQMIDGYSAGLGARVLVKNQGDATTNGIYIVNAGAWTRATDADTSAKVTRGMYTFIEKGTANGSSSWVLNTVSPDGDVVLGTSTLGFSKFATTSQISAGTGLTLSNNVMSVSSTYGGGSSIATVGTITAGTWNANLISPLYGGTGLGSWSPGEMMYCSASQTLSKFAGNSTTTKKWLSQTGNGSSPGAPAWSEFKYGADIGDGSTKDFTITHNLGSQDVMVAVYTKASPYSEVECDVERTSANVVTLHFNVAPLAAQYRVVVMG